MTGRAEPVSPTDLTTDEWPFYLLPLDEDIISLELPEFFRDNFLVNTQLKWLVWICIVYLTTNKWVLTGRGPEVGEDGQQRSAPASLPLWPVLKGLRDWTMFQGAVQSDI